MGEKLKQGQIVTIYEDPVTMRKPEGEAELIKELISEYKASLWLVKFLSDGFACTRWVKNVY